MACLEDGQICTAIIRQKGRLAPLPPSCEPGCFNPSRVPRDLERLLTEYTEGCPKRIGCCGQVIYDESHYDFCSKCKAEEESEKESKHKTITAELCDGKEHEDYSILKCKYCIRLTIGGKDSMAPKIKIKRSSKLVVKMTSSSGKDFGVYSNKDMTGKSYCKYESKSKSYVVRAPDYKTNLYYGHPGSMNSGNYIVVV